MSSNLPEDLLNAYQNNNLIPVLGAGVSMSITDDEGNKLFPSWVELLRHAADELKGAGEVDLANGITAMLPLKNFQEAAKYAREGLSGTTWSNFFRKHFDEPLTRISEDSKALPKAIWELGNRVLTLNYDKVMRGACPEIDRLVELDNCNPSGLADFKRGSLKAPAIWHFHGHTDNSSTLVFTSESYGKLYAETDKNYQAALNTFKGLCSDQRLLFVGCSLDDAELLHEMGKQHKLFEGNTGPHYALVHKNEHDAIQKKIDGLPIKLLTFENFGDPLVKRVKDIVSQSSKQLGASQESIQPLAEKQSPQVKVAGKRIALLSANPLDQEQQYTEQLSAFKRIGCSIDHFSLSIENLNYLQGYDYLLILSKVIKNRLLIEDEYLCSRKISFTELEQQIGNESTEGIFIFADHLPDKSVTVGLKLPILFLQEQKKSELSSSIFQLFKKSNLGRFKGNLVINHEAFELRPLTEKNALLKRVTSLPDDIDPKTIRNFVGRAEDLGHICRKLLDLEAEGGVLTIKGSGGIGKTTTVKKIAVALAERGCFEGGISFVNCESITDFPQFKYKVAAAFNLEQAEDLEQHLRGHYDKKSRLIILDNVETLLHLRDQTEIKKLLSFICDYATLTITSRERLQIEGEFVYEMRQLTTDEAEEIFLLGLDQRDITTDERALLRQNILEKLLDNNPLAIKLITGNMPKGKSLVALEAELETDLFSKISDMELKVFDDKADLNIARKKSIYGSILYSYRYLSEHEQRAFELLSLFPDGIDLEGFKWLTRNQKDSRNSSGLQRLMITDKVIKALENKSMIENSSGHIKLQSIVGKFAEAKLVCRENIERYYRNAFEYNRMLIKALVKLRKTNAKRALSIFNDHQGNLLKSISYCDKGNIDKTELLNYLEYLSQFFVEICSLKGFIRELSTKVSHFQGGDRQVIEVILISTRYFDGDFAGAYTELVQLLPLEIFESLTGSKQDRSIINIALNIYEMEGEALFSAKLQSKHMRGDSHYPPVLFNLGEYNHQLLANIKTDSTSLQVQANMGVLTLNNIDDYVPELYEKERLEQIQTSYLRSKLAPFSREEIDAMVTVNPYTSGLKKLMLAFIEADAIKASELYKSAIDQLVHIKYYYVEALYFFAKFLQAQEALAEFDRTYHLGLELAKKHHYRFLQYSFEQLLNPTGEAYDPRNYPLPDSEDFADYFQFLIKGNKRRKYLN